MWLATVALARDPDPNELLDQLAAIRRAAESGDTPAAAAATRALFVDRKSLGRVLRDDAPPGLVDAVLADVRTWSDRPDVEVATLLTPAGRTECRALSATTEQILAHQAEDFPGGAVELAQVALEPGVTWFEVSCAAPGEALGTRFHLFFLDRGAWRMLGPAWRSLP
jgi:hypothetical protein